jgi:hypothetical protein
MDLRPDKGGVFENFIISETTKRLKNLNINQCMYFYREYGGQEADLVLEDYYKNYKTVEMKLIKRGRVKDVFPLPHKFTTIDSKNYFEKISEILSKTK